MKSTQKKILSLLLMAILLISSLPVIARASALDASAYEGKTIACVGDSITAGVGATKGENDYVTLLSQQLGMESINLGASGTTLCTGGHRTCNIGQLTEAKLQSADVVTIAMGINDWDQAKATYYALGDSNSTDTSTIYGAARMWCERIVELKKTETLSDTQFWFVTPCITSWNDSVSSARNWDQSKTNVHGYTLRDLCNAIKEVCAEYEIPVIDMNLISGMYYVSAEDNNVAEFGGDGVHPGPKGHEMIANAMAKALLHSDLREDHDHVWSSWITTDYPTCQGGTEQRVCSVCTATESRSMSANNKHRYTSAVTAPTCTEKGYTTYTCLCGDNYVGSVTEALGHSYRNILCANCDAMHPNAETITLGGFSVAGVGTKALTDSSVQLSQKTLMAVPSPGAELTIRIWDGYQACVYSGNHNNKITESSEWLGTDGDGISAYLYTLPESSIYMRVSIRKTDGTAMVAEDLGLSGLVVAYESRSDVVEDNSDVVNILKSTEMPALIHISDIHGDVIRAERATYFAEQVGADALLASGDLTAYEPDDWGSAVLDVFGKYTVNTLYGIGNHDVRGISAAESPEMVYNAYYQDFALTKNGKTYYYQDLAEQKLRIISVNQTEGAISTTLGGTCFSQTQVDWLVETLASTPEGYGVVLMYHSPEMDPTGSVDAEYSEFYQSENRVSSTMTGYSKYTGTLLADLVDAFMMKDTIQANYSEGDGSSPVTVNADFTKVASGVEFIAHVTGHVHADTVTYLPGTFCKQLLLGVTCTTSMYGADGGYAKLADVSDLTREADSASQDAFNAYLIDRESKTVRVLRVGARVGDFDGTRQDMTIPYSIPFEEAPYPFDTEGMVRLELGDVEWLNYGYKAYGPEPTYKIGVRCTPSAVFPVPYDGVTLYVKINPPYEMGIRSGTSDSEMDNHGYWLTNKEIALGSKHIGYCYTIPEGDTCFLFSVGNITRSGENDSVTKESAITVEDMEHAGVEIWYKPLEHTHDYESVVTAPTCTEKGYTTHTCTVCGDSYVDSYVDMVWHDYAEGQCSMCGCDMLRITAEDIVRYQGGVNSEDGTLNTTFTNNWYTDISIPEGAEQVRVLTFKTAGRWGSAFFNEATYLSGFCDPDVGGQWVTVEVPETATLLRYGYLYDAIAQNNNWPAFQYLEFAGEELGEWERPEDTGRPATGCHSFSVEVNIAPAQGNPEGYTPGRDYGYIMLPTNYDDDGEPTRLIIVCHGASAKLADYQSDAWKTHNYSFWTDLGYAVMDMYACPEELGGGSELHYGNPVVLECYKKGYDYVMEHFNLKRDGIYVIGSSMGGLSSFQIVQSRLFPVLAQVGYCPVIDLFKQAYCNPWTTASYQRNRIASYFDFSGTAPTFTGSQYPSEAEIRFYQQNFDKTLAYSPIARNVVDGDVTKIFDKIPTSATATDAEEAAIYGQLTANHPCPLMIFHNTDDSVVSYRYSRYFVDMVNRSGQNAILRTFSSGGHNAWANGAEVTVQGINGNITLKESQYEAYLFFNQMEQHEAHYPWADPAVDATCTETGLTEGKHCAVCGEVTVKQEVTPATGHSYGYTVETAPTLTATGTLRGVCEICSKETKVELPMLDDVVYDCVVTAEPTYTETGSAAYTWKETAYGTYTFEVVLETLPILYGDVNGDGKVNNLDRLTLTRYLAKWTDYPAEFINMAAADVNADGTVNNLDRLILTRHLAKWTGYEELPYKK